MRKGEETRERILAAAERLIQDKGYSGTTLDDVLEATRLTKGAFFHHFKGKGDLARAVVERFTERDFALFDEWSARADRLSDDPLERMLIFLKLFEEFLDGLGEPFPGCVLATYTHENRQFGPEMHAFVRESFERWIDYFEAKLAPLLAARSPVRPASARGLAELCVSILEGGFIMARAMNDATWTQRASAELRTYLELLFRP
ncbi:MAG: TetR/AcrR family transcriptional regulator [Alphaproteobacteria bacterium]|nr:TetR/AcrR family transcriptional regulator [Alphaproteobacteria bacterium]